MITSHMPATWQELQTATAQILSECGLATLVEQEIRTVRGNVVVDVVATELVHDREILIFCECKRWRASIPQNVVHGFRTVVQDAGANVGYIISASPFQSGARAAAAQSNVRLLTWAEFQDEFEQQWLRTFLPAEVVKHLDPLFSYSEPINSAVFRLFGDATEDQRAQFTSLRARYSDFGNSMLLFSAYVTGRLPTPPPLPLRRPEGLASDSEFPPQFFTATSYREWLDDCTDFGARAIKELRSALGVTTSEYL